MSKQFPVNWKNITFGTLNSYSSALINPLQFPGEFFELYSVPSFPTGVPEISIGIKIGSTKQLLKEGDVLLCKINPRINRVWVVEKKTNLRQIGSSEWICFRASMLDSRFYRYYFSTPFFRKLFCTDLTGVGGSLTRAQPKRVDSYLVPVAPLAEQKRIADKLDALLARVDACRNRLDNIPGIIKRFRQAVLAAAISGKITEDWRDENSAPPWIQASVQDVALIGTGSTPLRSNPAFFAEQGTPWVTSAATSQTLVVAADEYVTPAAIVAHRLKIYPVGTLLVAMYGEGKTRGQVTELGIAATINQACAAIIVDEKKAIPTYVKFALQANYFEMRELAEGGNQPNLNLSKIKEFPLPLPGLMLEQAEIIRRVETLFAFADSLQAAHQTAQAKVEQLTPALLAKAFRGELVAQDPNDEPASVLLQKLAAAREVQDGKAKPGKKPAKSKQT